MNKTIWKFEINSTDKSIAMPAGAKILSIQAQAHQKDASPLPVLWALVNPDAPVVKRRIDIVGTGHVLDSETANAVFIGTVQLYGGSLVFHFFDLGEE